MTYNQKEKIKSLIKNDNNENILRRIIRNDNFPKYNISRRYITSSNDKNQSLHSKIPFYSIKKKYFPNTTKNSSIQMKQKDKFISESLNLNKLSTSSSIAKLNNNLRQLKNYNSSNDITNCHYNNHSIFISGQTKTPNGNYHIKIVTDKNNNYTKTIPKNLNQNFQFHPTTSTALYKRRGERNEEKKFDSNELYSSLNNIRNIPTNDFNNYRLNSITCKASNNHKISYNFSKNISNNNYDYISDSKTFHSQSKYSYRIRSNEESKSQKEKYTFSPKNILKDENLICERLKRNINMDKKFKILSINNSSKAPNFFFNPLKCQKSIKCEMSSNTLKKNNSTEKIKISFNRSLLQKSDSNHAIKITNESKNQINTYKLIPRKDRKEYKFNITERFKKEIHININKDKIKKLNNRMNNNNNIDNNVIIDNNINNKISNSNITNKNNKFICYSNSNFNRNISKNNNIISNNYTNNSIKNIYSNNNINNININNNNISNNNININISNNIQFKSIQIFSKNKNPTKDCINTLLINKNNKTKFVIIKKEVNEKNDKEEKEEEEKEEEKEKEKEKKEKIKNINEIIKEEIKLYNQKKNDDDKDNNIDIVSNKENGKNIDLKVEKEDTKKEFETEYDNKKINNNENNESKEEGRISQDLGIKDDFDIEEDGGEDKVNKEEEKNNDNDFIENKNNIEKEEIKEKGIEDEIINAVESNKKDEANKKGKNIDNNNEECKNEDIIIDKNEIEKKELELEIQINKDIGGSHNNEEKGKENEIIEIKEKNNEIKELSKQNEKDSKIKKKINHNLSKKLKIKHQNIIKKHKTNFSLGNQNKKSLKIDVSNQKNEDVIFLPFENQIKTDIKTQEQNGMVFDYISYSNLYEDESKNLNDNNKYQNTYENKPTSTNTNTNNNNRNDNFVIKNKKRNIPITLKLSNDNSLNDELNDIKIDEEYKPYVSKYPEKIFKKRGKAYKLKEKDKDKYRPMNNSITNALNKKILSLNTNKIDNNNNQFKYSSYFGDSNNNVYFEIKQLTVKNKNNSNISIKNNIDAEKKLINSTKNSSKKGSFSFFGVQSEALYIPNEN